MGGRATDIEGVPGDPNLVYAATGSGGLWKSTNGGQTWTALFERESAYSIGDIALEPGNPQVIWLGSGESNVRNSVSFGGGVFRSTDGGARWTRMGLEETERISRIMVHPTNPNIVWVGALGHAFGPSEHRGVYLATDGGKTWRKTLYLDNQHGVSDLEVDPANPNIVYAALWRFERKPWTHVSGSEKGGVWKSTDGGVTWRQLTRGLPKLIGRIGVKAAPSMPNVVYVICESKEATLYRSNDHGETFTEVNRNRDIVNRGFYYADLRVDPTDENRLYALATNLFSSIDGGKSFQQIARRIHSDHHALWIDPLNPRRMWLGHDGGFTVTHDRGATWTYVNNLALAQFYQLHADNREPFYYLMGGLQDNGSWTGPSRNREPAGILNDDWRMVSFGDGFFVINHPDDPDLYLTESQGGSLSRVDFRNRELQPASPQPKSNAGGPADGMKYRFNWNTPVVGSPHNKDTVYFGGNVLFRTQDFGRTWKPISPDLTTNNPDKQKTAGGPIWFDNSTAENHATIVTVSESPVRSGTIWAGTDDGNVQVTVNGGESWANVATNIAGLPSTPVVSHVEASRTSAATAYVAFDRHMFDDFRPYVYKSTDSGKTWQSIAGNLPANAYVHVIKEDPRNAALLYLGTEIGLFASWNGGQSWERLNLKNLPHVPVHEIIVHPRENDLILATHGRSIFILDDATPIQQMTAAIAAKSAHLFPIRRATRFTTRMTRYGVGDAIFKGQNPPYGALLTLFLKEKPAAGTPYKLEILNASGAVIRTLPRLPQDPGLHRLAWDLRMDGPFVRRERAAGASDDDDDDGGPQVLPGRYVARLTLGTQVFEQPLEVRMDPTLSSTAAELETQQRTLLELRDLQSTLNRLLKAADSVKEQLDQIEKQSKANGLESPRGLADYRKQLAALESALARPADAARLETGPGLVERVSGIFGGIDEANAAPTIYQLEVAAEVKDEAAKAIPAARRFFEQTVPGWGLPGLILPKL
jgi:photosystem II stability/assembly factor-like uncharacterized protein